MQSPEEQDDKPHEASQRKLDELRKKGDIVRSQDAVSLVSLSATLFLVFLFFQYALPEIIGKLSVFAELPDAVSSASGILLRGVLTDILKPVMLFFWVVPFIIIIAFLIGSRQLIFSPEKLSLKASRVSIVANAKKSTRYPDSWSSPKR